MKNATNLRVYRRTFEHLIILWNNKGAAGSAVNILVQDKDKWRPVEFVVSSAVEDLLGEKVPIPDQTTMAGIIHEKNKLDPNLDYRFKVVMSPTHGTPIETLIQVYKVGVLPNTEKDRKEAHTQLMAWDNEGQVWVKLAVDKIKVNGKFVYAVPTYLVQPDKE